MKPREIAIVKSFYIIGAISMGLIFLISGISKIQNPYGFLLIVYEYRLLSHSPSVVVASFLPWLEIVIGLCLLFRVFVNGAILGVIVLGVIFSIAQFVVIIREMSIPCGCFMGNVDDTISYYSLVRTMTLTVASIILYGVSRKFKKVMP